MSKKNYRVPSLKEPLCFCLSKNGAQLEATRAFLELCKGPLCDMLGDQMDSLTRCRVVVPLGATPGTHLRVVLSLNGTYRVSVHEVCTLSLARFVFFF